MSDDKTSDEGGARYEQVLANLRKRIIGGDYAPGERLPTFDAIQQQFDISRSVAQLAVTRLKQDGFVDTRNRRGLFVAENPPHLSRYGVVFPFTRSDPNWSRFNSTFTHELKSLGAHNLNPGRPEGLTGRARLQGLMAAYEHFRQPQGLPATYQVVYGILENPR